MQIASDLRLVVPIDDPPRIYAYHSPISREAYQSAFRLLRDAKVAMIGTSARHAFAARGDAALYLRDAGAAMARERDEEGDGGATALLAEIKRLTTVLVPGTAGYDMLPIDAAISARAISADDWSDAEASIVFFTAWAAGTPRREMAKTMEMAAGLIGGSITSLDAMAWAASLRTSIAPATTGQVAA